MKILFPIGLRVMIHEQYFYGDYRYYQPEFEEKLQSAFSFFSEHGYQSSFYENLISWRMIESFDSAGGSSHNSVRDFYR